MPETPVVKIANKKRSWGRVTDAVTCETDIYVPATVWPLAEYLILYIYIYIFRYGFCTPRTN